MKHYYYDFPKESYTQRKPKKEIIIPLVVGLYVIIVSLSIYVLFWK
jgi:hypothetical protein